MASMPVPLVRRRHHRFYNGMSLLIAAIVFAGFYRTFYLSPWLHGPALSPLRIVHGVVFSTWILLFPGRLLRFLTAPVPRSFVPNLFDFDGPPVGEFPGSWRVTRHGSIIALPTPGHSPGHTSFLVRRSEGDVLLAGDVTYDLPALHDQREQGFIAEVGEHRRTLPRVLSLVRAGVAYLPSHDPESPARLAGRTVVQPTSKASIEGS